ncbi:50S ribosomal protein L24e [Haloarcula sediminis]|uniref:50S ribosomal protein L24e n=1 Tax=Haloarcula sediminis TaxID=3111777 RepID=UPI002D77F27B|nr:50S ribosomal protein L24e [Haloarcula sp. CK38]
MPRTRDCDYCGADIEPGTGTMLVHNDGSTTHFCSSKCENNADLGREARNLGWTDAGRATTAAEDAAAAQADAEAEAEAEAEDAEANAEDADAEATDDNEDASEADEDADDEAEEAQA